MLWGKGRGRCRRRGCCEGRGGDMFVIFLHVFFFCFEFIVHA